MAFDFDSNATPLPRIEALEAAVNKLAGGGTDSEANTELDQRLTNIEEALRLTAAADKDLDQRLKDLDQRHKDLFAKVAALASGVASVAAKTTAPKTAA